MLGQRKDALEDKVADLEKQLDRMVGEQTRESRDTARKLTEAASGIRDNKIKEKIRYSKSLLGSGAPEQYARNFEEEIGANIDQLRKKLDEARRTAGQQGRDQERRRARQGARAGARRRFARTPDAGARAAERAGQQGNRVSRASRAKKASRAKRASRVKQGQQGKEGSAGPGPERQGRARPGSEGKEGSAGPGSERQSKVQGHRARAVEQGQGGTGRRRDGDGDTDRRLQCRRMGRRRSPRRSYGY